MTGPVVWCLLVCIASTLLPALLYLLFWNRQKFHQPEGLLDPLWRAPAVGHMLEYFAKVLRDPRGSHNAFLFRIMCGYAEVFRKAGMFRFWVCNRPVLMLYSAPAVQAILSSNRILEKSFEYRLLRPWLGTGLLTSGAAKWRSRRKMLTPAFHFKILEDFVPVLEEQSLSLVQRLRRAADEGVPVDVVSYATLCTLDVICETAMGVRVGAQQDSGPSPYVDALYLVGAAKKTWYYIVHSLVIAYRVGETFLARAMRPWLWPDLLFRWSSHGRTFHRSLDTLHTFTRKVIREKKAELLKCPATRSPEEQDLVVDSAGVDINANYYRWTPGTRDERIPDRECQQPKKRRAFLDLLLDLHIRDSGTISEEEIREEVDTFMFEGQDTTAMGLSWALYLVGLDPLVQDRLHAEMDRIFGEDRDRTPTSLDYKDMKYLECVIKEAQRLFPSVPYVGRQLTEETVIEGHTVPSGTTCCVFLYMLHRDPDVFPDPEVFDPDRFSSGHCAGRRHPFAYAPFSAGPRNCIGQKFASMEEKTLLAGVFRHFRIRSLDPRDVIQTAAEMVLRPKGGLRMVFQRR